MKTPNPDHPIRNTLKHLALAVAVAGGLLAGTALAAPANDDFANAIALTGVEAGQTGDNISGSQTGTNSIAATLESGEPNPGDTKTVWFKWTAPSDGQFNYRTFGSRNVGGTTWDAIAAIYTGEAVNDLVVIGGPQDTGLSESMTVSVTNGTTYSIQLAGYNGNTAFNILLRWDFVPDGPPTIFSSTPPDGSTMVVESDLVLTFDKPIAFGTGNITIKNLTEPANDRVMSVDPLDPQVSISGRVLTINPGTDLVLGNSYAVQIDATAIMDLVSQPFAGISDDTTWNFTTAAAIPTTTTVVSSGTPSTYGDNVTFTATVAPVPSGGTVQFRNNASNLGAPVPVNTTTGEATVTTSVLGVAGLNKIYAEYSGNFQFAGSTSASILQGVTKAGLTVTAQNVGRYPNTANPDPFPYQISSFKNGETLGTSGVTGTPELSTTAVFSSPVGEYPITCAVGTLAADNYDFTSFVAGTLTVVDPASPIVINVNIDKVVQPVLVGPAGGLGAVWNTIEPAVYGSSHPNLQTNYAPTSAPPASGPVTTVGLSVPYTTEVGGGGLVWGVDSWGSPSLLMLKSGAANFEISAANAQRFVITGLNPAKKYDLYVASANCLASQRSRGVWYTNNTTSTPGNHACDNTADIIGDNWVLGNNYVLFEDVVPDGSGKITVDGYSTGGYRLPLSGFQLVEVVAANDYNAWATTNGATGQTPDQDHDNDGVENGVEYFMGQTGSSFTAMPGLDATNTITWPASATYQGTYEVQTSPDLGTWTNVDPRPLPSGGNLSYLLPPGAPGGKSFVRLLVTPTP